MPLVATLMTHPLQRNLSSALVGKAASALGQSREPFWLSHGIACDLAVPAGMDAVETEARLRDALAGEQVDVAVQETENRRKKLLLADMDSTMIEQECIDELADEVGLKAEVAAITERSMRGEIEFKPALRARVALLKGLDVAVIGRILQTRIRTAAGAGALVATMRAHGAWTALVSGGFESFTGPVAAKLGFDEHRANRLLAEGGRLTGTVAEPILGREAKAEALLDITAGMGITPTEVIAVGDGANDLDMIGLAGVGVALHAKPAVAAAARFRVDHGDLTALLYLQGFTQAEFVEPA